MKKITDKVMNNIHWNVYLDDFNAREIRVFDVFKHSTFRKNVMELLNKHLDREEFAQKLKSETMYYFWAKAEYEVVITSFPPHITKEELDRLNSESEFHRYLPRLDTGVKVDVYSQLQLNWDRFVDYVFSFGL